MTHDELLAKLLVTDKTNMNWEVIKWQSALYAVVELCKKWETKGSYCLPIGDVKSAIEKELG